VDASAIAEVLIESRRAFLPFAPSARPPSEVRGWVAKLLIPSGRVHVAEADGRIVAVLATSEHDGFRWIDQLYVLPGYERRGIGALLLARAHKTLPPPTRLYTFQANSGARRFYERHGYRAIRFSDGSRNEEKCPDVLYERDGRKTEGLTPPSSGRAGSGRGSAMVLGARAPLDANVRRTRARS
jgi:GNAT superfamily N-acetyltransferase